MRLKLLSTTLVSACALLFSACVAQPGGTATQTSAGALTPGPSQTPGVAGAQPSPIPPATIDVSPPGVSDGSVSLSLAFEPARHMQDQALVMATNNQPQPAAPQATLVAGPPSQGALVLSDALHVTNNLDPTQPVPADGVQNIVRQAVVQVLTANSHQMIPYLTVTMDLLLDGHPVSFGQTLVPLVSQDASGQRVYYGNNVRLPQRGTFQVFIRLERTATLGQDAPPAAQFNVVVH